MIELNTRQIIENVIGRIRHVMPDTPIFNVFSPLTKQDEINDLVVYVFPGSRRMERNTQANARVTAQIIAVFLAKLDEEDDGFEILDQIEKISRMVMVSNPGNDQLNREAFLQSVEMTGNAPAGFDPDQMRDLRFVGNLQFTLLTL